MKIHVKTKYINETASLDWKEYNNGGLALLLVSEIGEPLGLPSINLDVPLPSKEHMYIKMYSENEGYLKCLVDAGVVQDTGERVIVNEYGSECALVRVLVDRAEQ